MLDCAPKLVAIDEDADHQIVHGRRVRKTHRAAHETLDPGPQIAGLALDALGGLFADSVRLGGEMPLVRAPSIRGKTVGYQRAPTGPGVRERREPCVARTRRRTRSHWREPSQATATAARLASPHPSTAHRALTSTHGAVPARQRGTARPPRALDGGASRPPEARAGGQVRFFSFLQDSGRTHMHPPHGLPHPAGMQDPIDDVALDVRRWPSLRIRQEKRAAVIRACPAPIPLLAVSCHVSPSPCCDREDSGGLRSP